MVRVCFFPFGANSSDERGATLVEFVLTGPMFLLTLLLVVETARVSFSILSAQYVLTSAIRFANVGGADPQPGECASVRLTEVRTFIENASQVHNAPFRGADVRICPITAVCDDNDADATNDSTLGRPSQYIRIDAPATIRYSIIGAFVPFTTTVIGKNENYPTAGSC